MTDKTCMSLSSFAENDSFFSIFCSLTLYLCWANKEVVSNELDRLRRVVKSQSAKRGGPGWNE